MDNLNNSFSCCSCSTGVSGPDATHGLMSIPCTLLTWFAQAGVVQSDSVSISPALEVLATEHKHCCPGGFTTEGRELLARSEPQQLAKPAVVGITGC